MIEAVIFDWAGTTIDYGCFAPVQAFIYAFEQFGITPTVEEVRKPMGMLKRDHIKTMLEMPRIRQAWEEKYGRTATEEDIDKVYAVSETGILNILTNFCDVKPHVLETIDTLRKNNIKIGSTTGYTDEMMDIVVPEAKKNGYAPDAWFSPNSVNNMGRPYPYMIFENLKLLHVSAVQNVIKVGDTISDIKEGTAAGVITLGVIEGSSLMALSQKEYEALSKPEQEQLCQKVKDTFVEAGADGVLYHLGELPGFIEQLEEK